MILAAGLPCWLIGFALDRQVAKMISVANSTVTTAESASRNVGWIQNIYWLAPYVRWISGALVVVGSVLAVISLLVARRSDDNVGTSGDRDRFLNP